MGRPVSAPSNESAVDRGRANGGPFHLKPTGPGTYLLRNAAWRLVAVRSDVIALRGLADAGTGAEWSVRREGARTFAVRAGAGGRRLAVDRQGGLTLGGGAAARLAVRVVLDALIAEAAAALERPSAAGDVRIEA